MDTNKIWVELIISEFDITPDEFTTYVGVSPTEAETKGEDYKSLKGEIRKNPYNLWRLSSGANTDVDLETQVKMLLDKIRPSKERFKKFFQKYSPDLNIVVHIHNSNATPYIGWDNEIMKELGEYNFSWGIDLSICDEE